MRTRIIILATIAVILGGCDLGFKQLGPTESSVKFRLLPRWLGGGVAQEVGSPGELVYVLPWERLYRFDTKIKNLEWGARGSGSTKERDDYVQTRALDGNEVALSVGVQYQISNAPEDLKKLLQQVATTEAGVEELVVSASRADIRTWMNYLRTAQFFRNEDKYRGEAEVRAALERRLRPYGILVRSVNLREHRFERLLPDGSIDRRYQERINQVQAIEQEINREQLRIKTVVAEKERERANMGGRVNRQIEEAKGVLAQAQFRGDAYLAARENEAQAISAKGEAEAEGLRQRAAALAGPGGRDLVKLELARQLQAAEPKFVVVETGSGGTGLTVQRLDTNELLQQIGILEGLKAGEPKPQVLPPEDNVPEKELR